jgi:ribulose-5-phosphate 4-epimerase/fuculose-1-phosphate aldolase
MHGLIYASRPEAGAIVHAHDPQATREALAAAGLIETEQEEPYGTVALARRAIEALGRNESVVALRNHGYVSAGPDLATVIDQIVATHLRLVGFDEGAPHD